MYSLHSWFGMITVGFLFTLWFISFFVFVWPGAENQFRKKFVIYHRFWGVVVFGMGTTSCILGILEKQTFLLESKTVTQWAAQSFVANATGIMFLVTGLAVFFQVWTKQQEETYNSNYHILDAK